MTGFEISHVVAAPNWSNLAAASGESGEKRPPRFEMVANSGSRMRLAGYEHDVVIDLSGVTPVKATLPIRFQHSEYSGVGHADKFDVVDGKLLVSGVISRSTDAAREIVESARNGFPWQASIGGNIDVREEVDEGVSVEVNGQTHIGPLIVARKTTLHEVSFVELGADSNTEARIAAQKAGKAGGVIKMADNPKKAGPEINAKPGPEKTDTPVAASVDPVADIRARALAETTRIDEVSKVSASFPDIRAKAIGEGWDATKTELAVLRAEREQVKAEGSIPHALVRSGGEPTSAIIEAAACRVGRLSEATIVKDYGEQAVSAADTMFRNGISVREMIELAARANGYSGNVRHNFRDTFVAAMGGMSIAASASKINIPSILANVANKFMIEGYNQVETSWRAISKITPVNDFKQQSYVRLNTSGYEIVAPNGEIKRGQISDEAYGNKADTRGLILEITRQNIINDDLGVLSEVPRKLGQEGGRALNNLFYQEYLDNATFFTTARKNYFEGANSALTAESLAKAQQMLMDQTDAFGNPIGLSMSGMTLFVPSTLWFEARRLTQSTEIRTIGLTVEDAASSQGSFGTMNPHQGQFMPVTSSYLSATKIGGKTVAGSGTAWYLVANPAVVPVIDVAFLNGRETPIVETAQADFDNLGIKMRGYHDFGVQKQDYRAGIKSKGVA